MQINGTHLERSAGIQFNQIESPFIAEVVKISMITSA
ncbi:hypothetical protein HDF16_001973 [Granulicella aggregans]|uniref:Uncharacterized protein n=1 Tax=Granulicella aggregans TaxID=474949 RepID=A0A7W8E2U7_9BACT|nr:hypothetical protein [Granulicella aggregans]